MRAHGDPITIRSGVLRMPESMALEEDGMG